MNDSALELEEARHDLYELLQQEIPFEEFAERALQLGKEYLDVENGHLTKIDSESDYWKALASTDPPCGTFPPGLIEDLNTTYCRKTIEKGSTIALHDAVNQGWEDDPAFETHRISCYHGTPLFVSNDTYGTVCFVSEEARDQPFTADETLFAELIARMIEHELQQQHIQDRVERLDQFANIISYDLRNPLNVAQGRIGMARNATENPHLETAENALDRMDTIITEVLAMAQQGKEVEETEKITLSGVADESWLAVATPEANMQIDQDLVFTADIDRCRQLFESLFRNAIEHGGDDVTVRVGPLRASDGFYVEDDGPGIPESERDDVFETGYATGEDGVGLGLAIVDEVVSAHHWNINVATGRDGGARFEISNVVTDASEV